MEMNYTRDDVINWKKIRVTGHLCGEFTGQRPATWGFIVFVDQHPNKRLSKQSWDWWFEMPSLPLWRHYVMSILGETYTYTVLNIWGCQWQSLTFDTVSHNGSSRVQNHAYKSSRVRKFMGSWVYAIWKLTSLCDTELSVKGQDIF